MAHGQTSEDCLYLNVWTAGVGATQKRPVYVYLHGGGFNEGSGSVAVYDGEGLARKGLVVVTVNYRLGALGFLAHPELTRESPHHASGNYGLLDQVAALHIGVFGDVMHRRVADHRGVVGAMNRERDQLLGAVERGHREGVGLGVVGAEVLCRAVGD